MNSRLISEHALWAFPVYRNLMDCYANVRSPMDRMGWWDMYHRTMLLLAVELATPGYTCLRPPGAAGAILSTSDGARVLGCAEPPVGATCKDEGSCEIEDGHCVRTIHAEIATILYAACHGYTTGGGRLYSILKPCYQCTKAIIAAGIDVVYYAGAAYNEDRTKRLADLAGLQLIHLDIGLNYGQ